MLRRSIIVALYVLTLTTFGAAQVAQKDLTPKTIKFTVHLAQGDATVTVDGKEVDGEGEKRTLTVPLAAGKKDVQVVAVWEPNNYTRITRPRKVTWKEGDIVADFREPSNTEKDDIVVIFVPTPQEFVDAMCKMAKIGKDDVVYDLGCGDGRMVLTAVKSFNAKRGVGIDLDPDLVAKCKDSAKKAGLDSKLDFRQGDVLKVKDLSEANVVLLYMGDDINLRLKPILQQTLKPGSRVISHRFLMGDDWPPDRSERVKATMGEYPGYEHDIHLWVIKDNKKK